MVHASVQFWNICFVIELTSVDNIIDPNSDDISVPKNYICIISLNSTPSTIWRLDKLAAYNISGIPIPISYKPGSALITKILATGFCCYDYDMVEGC